MAEHFSRKAVTGIARVMGSLTYASVRSPAS
jgi:hypothetical protein